MKDFFTGMTTEQRQTLEALVMDMWDTYILAISKHVPYVKIASGLFHVVSSFGKVIDKVRNAEFNKALKQDRDVLISSKYILLKNKRNVRKKKHREYLKQLLSLNETINTVLFLKDKFKHIWYYRAWTWARKVLDEW